MPIKGGTTQMVRMIPNSVHDFHHALGARFIDLGGQEAVSHYGDPLPEHSALHESAGLLDLSFRGRLCLAGSDRRRFLNGQVTNNVSDLKIGEGCYAALVTAKGKMLSDLNICILENEILLDFEPGLATKVAERLEKYIIADDVQVLDAAPHYGLLSVQGPKAAETLRRLELEIDVPSQPMGVAFNHDRAFGEVYLMNLPRLGTSGFDWFVPRNNLLAAAQKLSRAAAAIGGRYCGWQALETARIEAGIPRFGADMDESTLPPEAGLEDRAISYSKGCYIGQEVIARIRTYGQVAKALRGLRLSDELEVLPARGDKLFRGNKEVGYITSAVDSPRLQCKIALGYVRREANQIGTELAVRSAAGQGTARIVKLPFHPQNLA